MATRAKWTEREAVGAERLGRRGVCDPHRMRFRAREAEVRLRAAVSSADSLAPEPRDLANRPRRRRVNCGGRGGPALS